MFQEKVAATAAVLSITGAVLGTATASVNDYLQAGAFIVAMISGLAATVYYIVKIFRK